MLFCAVPRFVLGYGHKVRLPTSTVIRVLARASASSPVDQTDGADVDPPFKRHRDSLSVLRALASCVIPSAEAPDFRLGGDPWLGSPPNTRNYLLAKAKGRMAARLAIQGYFPNDIVALAKETPRVDRWLPLQTPDEVLKRVFDGELPISEGMNRLLLLLAATHAWKLYTDVAPEEPWTDNILHRLLDLLCATNNGVGGAHSHPMLDSVDLTTLPDPGEIYFAEELAIQSDNNRFNKTLLKTHGPADVPVIQVDLTSEAATTAEAEVTSSSSESESDGNMNSVSDTDEPVGRCTWQIQGPAEQLFSRMHTKLKTPAGYASIIRGAAKFHHPRRALELLEAATAANIGPLNISVYAAVLRCLHALPTSEIRTEIEKILKHISALESPVPLPIFEAALYCLAESVRQQSESNQPVVDYASFALGLFNSIRQSGFECSLSAMANLLRVLHFIPLQSNRSRPLGYRCSPLIDNFVLELNRRFQANPPTRFDSWSMDDCAFFPIAMRIASMENNPDLGRRIDHLLTGAQDRRFFLATSLLRRKYIQSYCFSQISPSSLNAELKQDPVRLIERVEQVYRNHWGTIITTHQLCHRLTSFFQRFFDLANTLVSSPDQGEQSAEQKETIKSAQRSAYCFLHQMLTDLLDNPRSPTDYRLPDAVRNMSPLMLSEVHHDPSLAAKFSAAVLKRATQIDERSDLIASRSSKETKRNSPQPTPPLSANEISLFIRMLFPLLSRNIIRKSVDLPTHSSEVSWRRELIQTTLTLDGWIRYALKHRAVSWSWTPESLHMSWKNDESEISIGIFWDALRVLCQKDFKPADSVEAKRIQHALIPLLDDLEYQMAEAEDAGNLDYSDSTHQSELTERRRILNRLRQVLDDRCKVELSSEQNPLIDHAKYQLAEV